jgi:hypothetical protein
VSFAYSFGNALVVAGSAKQPRRLKLAFPETYTGPVVIDDEIEEVVVLKMPTVVVTIIVTSQSPYAD